MKRSKNVHAYLDNLMFVSGTDPVEDGHAGNDLFKVSHVHLVDLVPWQGRAARRVESQTTGCKQILK